MENPLNVIIISDLFPEGWVSRCSAAFAEYGIHTYFSGNFFETPDLIDVLDSEGEGIANIIAFDAVKSIIDVIVIIPNYGPISDGAFDPIMALNINTIQLTETEYNPKLYTEGIFDVHAAMKVIKHYYPHLHFAAPHTKEFEELAEYISVFISHINLPNSAIIEVPPPSNEEITLMKRNWDEILSLIYKDFSNIYELPSRLFEELIAESLQKEGYIVELTSARKDGGRDILAYHDSVFGKHLHLVECKRYAPDNKIPVSLVRQLYGVVSAERANSATLITTSSFTKPALDFALPISRQLSLRDGKYLQTWLQQLKDC